MTTINGNIKINPRQVYYTGIQYSLLADKVRECQNKINKICEDEVEDAWIGGDNHNFIVSLTEHAALLDDLVDFLENKSSILKETALNHNTSDNNLEKNISRGVDIDEYKLRG